MTTSTPCSNTSNKSMSWLQEDSDSEEDFLFPVPKFRMYKK